MNQLQTGNTSTVATTGKKNPYVIVPHADQTVRFKIQNYNISRWLRNHYHSSAGNVKGDTEVFVHPTRCKRIVEELRAAGFVIRTL